MLTNYLKILFRDLKRNKSYTFINIGGLAVGFACCILIALYVRSELSHDDFYKYADRLVVVGINSQYFGRGMSTPYPLSKTLESEIPSVKKAVRTLRMGSGEISGDGEHYFKKERVFFAGDDFFEMFSFLFVKGTKNGALDEPNTAVISANLTKRLFPDKDPIGQIVYVKKNKKKTYKITGVAKSRNNSYFNFNLILSESTFDFAPKSSNAWGIYLVNTFALLKTDPNLTSLNFQLKRLGKRHYGKNSETTFFAEKISNFYLSDLSYSKGFSGQWFYIYLFGSIALFILLLACVNYINLSTARATKRAREVVVRKTLGADRSQIIKQFIGESLLISSSAFIIALFLAWLVLPVFNVIFKIQLTFSDAGVDWFLWLGVITLGIGFLAGSYPAFYLSQFNPVNVLKKNVNNEHSGSLLRKSLITVQFIVATALIIGTLVIFRQLHFMQTKELGFEGEQVVITHIPGEKAKTFRQKITTSPHVKSATITTGIPGRFIMMHGFSPKMLSSDTQTDTSKASFLFSQSVDYNYIETLRMKMAAGRQFLPERSSDRKLAYIINETMAEALGWTPEEAIGKPFQFNSDAVGKVIGVVKDFHISSLHSSIKPVVLQLWDSKNLSPTRKQIAVRLASGHTQEGLRQIENIRTKFTAKPFEYTFLDDEFAKQYREERRLAKLFGGFAGIAILLACMGILGLATFAAERRTKEIGIRKVMGASVTNILWLISEDFLKLVLIGFVVAVPVAFYFMNQWLQNFAYRIDLGAGIFLLAGGLALLIALATVSWQSIRAALANPVDSLRSE